MNGHEPDHEITVTEPIEAEAPQKTPDEIEEDILKTITQTVDISDVGPCKKHVKVSVDRTAIDALLGEKYKELVVEAQVPGFRPGKAPRQVVVRKFEKEVKDQVKNKVLLASLSDLMDKNQLSPLTSPQLDPRVIDIPKEGPFIYEFEVEVRPEFDLPEYRGLKLKRPVKVFTDAEVEVEKQRTLRQFGKLIDKESGIAEVGDHLLANWTAEFEGKVVGKGSNLALPIQDNLALRDGVIENFIPQAVGAKAGSKITCDMKMSDSVADAKLAGQTLKVELDVKAVKQLEMPELTHEFLHTFGVHNPEQLHEKVRAVLESRLEYAQVRAAREQVMHILAANANLELPRDMLTRQARSALARRVMEMREAGMSDEDIRGRERMLRQDVLRSTELQLRESFVLQKIAEVEKIELEDADIDAEIDRLADQYDESPRRVRAQLERDNLMESLAVQLVERRALELILESAQFEDMPLQAEKAVTAVEQQAVAGELREMPEAPAKEAE